MRGHNYKLFIFDMDGTLLDTSHGILQAARHTIEVFHKNMPCDEKLRTFIGPPLRSSFEGLPDVSVDEIDDMVKCFRKQYSEKELLHAAVYEGIAPLCKRLKLDDIQVAVATNKPEIFAKQLVQHFHLGEYMSVVCGADEQGNLTKADLIYKVMDLTHIEEKSQAVMVGDTFGDADAAYECGIDFIGVTYGFGLSDDKDDAIRSRAIHMASSPYEIYEGDDL